MIIVAIIACLVWVFSILASFLCNEWGGDYVVYKPRVTLNIRLQRKPCVTYATKLTNSAAAYVYSVSPGL